MGFKCGDKSVSGDLDIKKQGQIWLSPWISRSANPHHKFVIISWRNVVISGRDDAISPQD
jgi:hypothetical protein